ncbi:MAG: terminase TerL endonuclease subunit, partial [Oscillospiraceae bacterium]|nr:terminase TerL endonuclease subunit [Oscillospiraceae bacterium]
MPAPHEKIVMGYAETTAISPRACLDVQAACKRFLADLQDPRWDFRTDMAESIIEIIETLFCHQQGEDLSGRPMRGKPLILEPFQLFIIYNLCGFFLPDTDIRRYQEAMWMLARKNGKTPFATAFCWAMGLWYSRSFSKIKTVAGSMKQNMEGFGFLSYNLHRLGLTVIEDAAHGLRVLDSSLGHSFSGSIWEGQISFEALAYKPDIFDAFNANIVLLDELELYKNAIPYGRLKDATKAYSNKLILAVTTAGDDGTGFCAQRMAYCSKIVRGEITGADADRIFAFLARADPDPETQEVNYLDPLNWQKANPNWGVTIRPEDMEASALQAMNDPQMRKEFLTRSLNVFVSSFKAWFNIDEFVRSDTRYNFTLPQLVKLVKSWYGGADLSKLHDLTAAAIVGEISAKAAATTEWTPKENVLVIIPHCWFPVVAAAEKADKDNIPLFGWKEDGWLDMPNEPSMDPTEPVKQFLAWKKAGFNIRKVGHDRKFARPYYAAMKKARFTVVDQPQLAIAKSEGLRYIEHKAKIGCLYYCHAEPFSYCVQNVRGQEKQDDVVVYDKVSPNARIDVFDASVFATIRMLIDTGKAAD